MLKKSSRRSYWIPAFAGVTNKAIIEFVLLFFCLTQMIFASTPAFIIYNDGVNLSQQAETLEQRGGHIRQQIPPQILVIDLPNTMRANNISGTKQVFTSVIPLSNLDPYGPLAVAAGMQWNRSALKTASVNNLNVGAMRALVAEKSLPATSNVQIKESDPATLSATWAPIDGALAYQTEAAKDSGFSEKYFTTHSNIPQCNIPIAEGIGKNSIFIRVRGVDYIENSDGKKEEVFGAWSKASVISVSLSNPENKLSTPLQTSPIADYISAGFTLILEWNNSLPSRVQVAKSNNFNETWVDTIVSNGEFVVPSPGLNVEDALYWRVKLWGDEKSNWSSPRKIQIGAPHHEHTDTFINPEAPR